MLGQKVNEGVSKYGIALMTHIVVGYPSIDDNKKVLEQMQKANVELVEFQFPFSEPVADGPLFAMANQASLENGITIQDCFDLISWASKKFDFSILMMGYYNTVFKRGEEKFLNDLVQAGGKGVIVPDIPVEESETLRSLCQEKQIDFIHLLTPTTTSKRLAFLAEEINAKDTFTYVVARKGTTGTETDFALELSSYLEKIKTEVKKPLGLGFGISSIEDVSFLKGKVEMAILGSKVLRVYEESGADAVGDFLSSLR